MSFQPMLSAYKEYWGEEPAFTNYAYSGFSQDGQAFQETLDYVFLSWDQWRVTGAKELPSPDSVSHVPGFPSVVAAGIRQKVHSSLTGK